MDCFVLDVVGEVIKGDEVECFLFEGGLKHEDLIEVLEVLYRQELEQFLEVTVCIKIGQCIYVDDRVRLRWSILR